MTKDRRIYIKNIYYMMSYAFHVLKQKNYEKIEAESFEHSEDLFAAILAIGVAQQVKQGLYREYISREEELTMLRGKILFSETIKNRMQRKNRVCCAFEELSENNLCNQILKTTMCALVRCPNVENEQKQQLKRLLVFFDAVTLLQADQIRWDRVTYQKNNKNYEMLLNLCYFIWHGILMTTQPGVRKIPAFFEGEPMHWLYEKFILEYYRQEHSWLDEVSPAQIYWNLTGPQEPEYFSFLPGMQTDITLVSGEKTLIIDAKYYQNIWQEHNGRQTLPSANMYQIYTYVKNRDKKHTGNVAGLLLYAKTDARVVPDCRYNMDGNWIGAKTLDLNQEFSYIRKQLDEIVENLLLT